MSIRIDGTTYFESIEDYFTENGYYEDVKEHILAVEPLLNEELINIRSDEVFCIENNQPWIVGINEIINDLHKDYIDNYNNPVIYEHDELGLIIVDKDEEEIKNDYYIELNHNERSSENILFDLLVSCYGVVDYLMNEEYL
jgi:glucosamine 6-phosphate synthetase-like amidotransferase/phosphosugar isomerase protein